MLQDVTQDIATLTEVLRAHHWTPHDAREILAAIHSMSLVVRADPCQMSPLLSRTDVWERVLRSCGSTHTLTTLVQVARVFNSGPMSVQQAAVRWARTLRHRPRLGVESGALKLLNDERCTGLRVSVKTVGQLADALRCIENNNVVGVPGERPRTKGFWHREDADREVGDTSVLVGGPVVLKTVFSGAARQLTLITIGGITRGLNLVEAGGTNLLLMHSLEVVGELLQLDWRHECAAAGAVRTVVGVAMQTGLNAEYRRWAWGSLVNRKQLEDQHEKLIVVEAINFLSEISTKWDKGLGVVEEVRAATVCLNTMEGAGLVLETAISRLRGVLPNVAWVPGQHMTALESSITGLEQRGHQHDAL